MNTSLRLAALRAALKKQAIHALAVTHLTNVRYLCGFTGSSGMLLVSPKHIYFITDFRYAAQAQHQIGDVAEIVIAKHGLWKEAAKIAGKHASHDVGIEAEHMSVATFNQVKALLPKGVHPTATEGVVEALRLAKDEAELSILREAVRIADETFAEALELLKPGISEKAVAAAIESGIKARGGTGTSFDTIVASGMRSALPHGVASDKIIEKGDLVTIDMGARYGGYCSDMTRTVCVGKASKTQKEIYELVYRAQVAAVEALRPGLSCKAADTVARDIIDAAGHKKQFGHGLGHGVGIDIHEAPRLSPLGKGKLHAGMIVTCEPGVYVADFGGVRIEDMLHITNVGAEILTQTPKPAKLLEV